MGRVLHGCATRAEAIGQATQNSQETLRAMTATTDAVLVEQVAQVFKLACQKQDWDLAEFFFPALEAISRCEGSDGPVNVAYDELMGHLPGRDLH